MPLATTIANQTGQEINEFLKLLQELQTSSSNNLSYIISAVVLNFILILFLYWRNKISNAKNKNEVEILKAQNAEATYSEEIKNRTLMANMMQEMLLRDSQEYRHAIKQELEETKKDFAANEEQRRELQKKVDNLIEDLKLANQRLETATKNSFVIMGLKQQVGELSIALENFKKEVERLTSLNLELTATIQTLEVELNQKEKVIQSLQRQVEEIKNGN